MIMDFATRLKELRTGRQLTQGELSKALNMSQSAIAMYENGKREPKIEALEIFADFFNVDMNYITGKSNLTTKLSPLSTSPQVTNEEYNLVCAYRHAPPPIQDIVNTALAPYAVVKCKEA